MLLIQYACRAQSKGGRSDNATSLRTLIASLRVPTAVVVGAILDCASSNQCACFDVCCGILPSVTRPSLATLFESAFQHLFGQKAEVNRAAACAPPSPQAVGSFLSLLSCAATMCGVDPTLPFDFAEGRGPPPKPLLTSHVISGAGASASSLCSALSGLHDQLREVLLAAILGDGTARDQALHLLLLCLALEVDMVTGLNPGVAPFARSMHSLWAASVDVLRHFGSRRSSSGDCKYVNVVARGLLSVLLRPVWQQRNAGGLLFHSLENGIREPFGSVLTQTLQGISSTLVECCVPSKGKSSSSMVILEDDTVLLLRLCAFSSEPLVRSLNRVAISGTREGAEKALHPEQLHCLQVVVGLLLHQSCVLSGTFAGLPVSNLSKVVHAYPEVFRSAMGSSPRGHSSLHPCRLEHCRMASRHYGTDDATDHVDDRPQLYGGPQAQRGIRDEAHCCIDCRGNDSDDKRASPYAGG